MTIKELIEQLYKFDEDLDVYVALRTSIFSNSTRYLDIDSVNAIRICSFTNNNDKVEIVCDDT